MLTAASRTAKAGDTNLSREQQEKQETTAEGITHIHTHPGRPGDAQSAASQLQPTAQGRSVQPSAPHRGELRRTGVQSIPPPGRGQQCQQWGTALPGEQRVLERRLRLSLVSSTFPEPTPVALCLLPPSKAHTHTGQQPCPPLPFYFLLQERG